MRFCLSLVVGLFLFLSSLSYAYRIDYGCRGSVTVVGGVPAHEAFWGPLSLDQKNVIETAADLFLLNGTLLSSDPQVCYAISGYRSLARIVGRAQYRPNGPQAHLRIFDSPAHYWVNFDGEIQRRIEQIERRIGSGSVRTLRQGDRDALERYQSFHILSVPLRREADGSLPMPYLQYVEARRGETLPDYVELAVDHLENSGELIGPENGSQIIGITYDQMLGLDYYGAEQDGSYKRVWANSAQFWVAFDKEVERRIAEGSDSEHLRDFSIFNVYFKIKENGKIPKEILALFDKHRPREQQKYLIKAINILARTGITITFPNAGDTFDEVWTRVMGRQGYGPEGGQRHRRLFDDPAHHWIEFEKARKVMLEGWPAGALRGGRNPAFAVQYNNLTGFSPMDVRLQRADGSLPRGIPAMYQDYRVRERKRVVQTLVDHYLSTGDLVEVTSCRRLTGHQWIKLVGKQIYDPAVSHQYIFSSYEQFWRAFKKELEERRSNRLSRQRVERIDAFNLAATLRRFGN